MPRLAAEHPAVLEGRLSPADIYENARYDAGYRMGWRDAHRMARFAHQRTQKKYAEYATGYKHGWADGKGHPCAEWDEAHRLGPLSALPIECPWSTRR